MGVYSLGEDQVSKRNLCLNVCFGVVVTAILSIVFLFTLLENLSMDFDNIQVD